MAASPDTLKACNRALTKLETLFRDADADAAHIRPMTALLRELDDASIAGACRLAPCQTVHVSDAHGQQRDDWAAMLADSEAWSEAAAEECRDSPLQLEGKKQVLVVAGGTATMPRPAAFGLIVSALGVQDARELLIGFARHAWLLLEHTQMRKRLDEERRKGDVAESAGVLHHELGNLLNNLALDAAALERELKDSPNERPREIRALVMSCAERIKDFMQYRNVRLVSSYPVDVNEVVRAALAPVAAESRPHVELASSLPPVRSTRADLARIVDLLLTNTVAASAAPAAVTIRTERQDSRLRLTIEDWGEPLADEDWLALFEPFERACPTVNSLEVAVCQSLLRRLNATLRGFNRPGGGASFACEFRIEEPDSRGENG